MSVAYYISEGKSGMRGIKQGWYVIEDDGSLSSGPLANWNSTSVSQNSAQPTNETMAHEG